jgi:DNA-binding transcriptional MerR regulator
MQVGDVARATGVSVRTLHHWEEVGLVAPSGRTAKGYRAYADADVARVRSVVAWRELGLSLDDIRLLLAEGVTTARLEAQHARLVAEGERIASMAGAVARALEARRMGIELDPAEVRAVFGDADPTEHAAEAEQRWGGTDAYAESHRRTSTYSKDDWLRMRAEQDDLEGRMAAAMAAGEPGVDLAREHQELISRWFYDCTPETHLGLAEMYVGDDRFRQHYERRAAGLAEWLRNAIVAAHA